MKRAPIWILILIGLVLIGIGVYTLIRKPNTSTSFTPPASDNGPYKNPTPQKQEPVSQSLIVSGTDKWKDSGITVKKGQTVSISATGSVVWDEAQSAVGPSGRYPAIRLQQPSDFPMPEAGVGSLVMKIGTVKYAVGASRTVTATEGGRIYFMTNDRYDYLWNNSGSFEVSVTVE